MRRGGWRQDFHPVQDASSSGAAAAHPPSASAAAPGTCPARDPRPLVEHVQVRQAGSDSYNASSCYHVLRLFNIPSWKLSDWEKGGLTEVVRSYGVVSPNVTQNVLPTDSGLRPWLSAPFQTPTRKHYYMGPARQQHVVAKPACLHLHDFKWVETGQVHMCEGARSGGGGGGTSMSWSSSCALAQPEAQFSSSRSSSEANLTAHSCRARRTGSAFCIGGEPRHTAMAWSAAQVHGSWS